MGCTEAARGNDFPFPTMGHEFYWFIKGGRTTTNGPAFIKFFPLMLLTYPLEKGTKKRKKKKRYASSGFDEKKS